MRTYIVYVNKQLATTVTAMDKVDAMTQAAYLVRSEGYKGCRIKLEKV